MLLCASTSCSSPSAPPTPAIRPYTPDPPVAQPTRTIIDSHVHLAFYPVAPQLAEHGIGGAVDLAAPERALGTRYPIMVIQAGPMLTHPGGYPLDAWGSDGYGIGCDSVSCVTSTIDRLKSEGASVIKLALDEDGLAPGLARAATIHAHALRMKVVAHALSDKGARLAADVGVDVLAHTPVEPLSDQTVMACGKGTDRAVITTLAAFGGSPAAIENLRKLRAAGVTVLYGTDLGNLRVDGPSTEEVALMKQAGMSDDEVESAMTTVPWHFWGFDAIERK